MNPDCYLYFTHLLNRLKAAVGETPIKHSATGMSFQMGITELLRTFSMCRPLNSGYNQNTLEALLRSEDLFDRTLRVDVWVEGGRVFLFASDKPDTRNRLLVTLLLDSRGGLLEASKESVAAYLLSEMQKTANFKRALEAMYPKPRSIWP